VASAYSDLDRPPLSATGLSRALVRPGSLWTAVRVVAETGSTNAEVTARAASEPEGLVIAAESQTGGRGRWGRAWMAAPQAGLTFSVLLRPSVSRERWGWLPLLAGLAVARAVGQVAELEAAVKWPNDVLLGAKRGKVAGVLAEVSGDAVVLGIGVNVTNRRAELPETPGLPGRQATSLALEKARCFDRMPLLVAILRALAEDYGRWLGGADVRQPYLQRCETVGRPVQVSYPDGRELTGHAVDVDTVGRLVVVDGAGTRTAVASGDVVHVRPKEG